MATGMKSEGDEQSLGEVKTRNMARDMRELMGECLTTLGIPFIAPPFIFRIIPFCNRCRSSARGLGMQEAGKIQCSVAAVYYAASGQNFKASTVFILMYGKAPFVKLRKLTF
jgi:hypothetical protein